jgi:hypothetical protein
MTTKKIITVIVVVGCAAIAVWYDRSDRTQVAAQKRRVEHRQRMENMRARMRERAFVGWEDAEGNWHEGGAMFVWP